MKLDWKNWQFGLFVIALTTLAGAIFYDNVRDRGDCNAPKAHKSLNHCNFVDANFSGKNLHDLEMDNFDFSGANFDDAVFINMSFKHANFNGATFKNAYILFTDFTDACFIDADFTGAHFHKINHWNGADLTKANLKNTMWDGKLSEIQSTSYRLNCGALIKK